MGRRLLMIILPLLLFCSCRMNNGDIGDLFGSWLLYSMTVDGQTPEDFDAEETVWEFQNNIISISRVEFMYDKESRWGTWSEADGKLLLNYTHHEHGVNQGTAKYSAPEWLGFPPNQIIPLTFVERTSNRMSLTRTSENGEVYVYSLRKIW